jgi:hypothetical protein
MKPIKTRDELNNAYAMLFSNIKYQVRANVKQGWVDVHQYEVSWYESLGFEVRSKQPPSPRKPHTPKV